jgi:hypothetical protein
VSCTCIFPATESAKRRAEGLYFRLIPIGWFPCVERFLPKGSEAAKDTSAELGWPDCFRHTAREVACVLSVAALLVGFKSRRPAFRP